MTACLFAFETPGRHETWQAHQLSPRVELGARFGPAQSFVGLGIDIYVLILPMIGLSKLQMPLSRKIGVGIIFMSAILACLGSALSIVYRWKLLINADTTWLATPVFITTGTLTRYYHVRLLSKAPSKGSENNKNTLVEVINLYESDGTTSGQPTRKDRYELYGTSKAMSGTGLQPSINSIVRDYRKL
ncbi:MAG: hypothetical protein Q9219_007390 [cf. Caloplaca sp. 3 TL-2023]